MWSEPTDLLIVSNSGRAMAESAARGGYRVTVLDAFCDADTRAVASCITVPMKARGLDPEHLRGETGRLAVLGGGLGLVYGAGLEHTPDTLAWMAERFRLIGNPPRVLELLANPGGFFALLDRLDIPYPETRSEPPAPGTGGQWLVKEAGTSGGLGVRRWHDGDPRPIGTHYFQQFIDGPVLSVLFIANGADCTLIGTNRLRTAPLDGVSSFRYGGAVTRAVSNAGQRAQIERQCRVLVRALGLRGVNNLDYVLQGAEMRLLELNPRPSATLGLSEADVSDKKKQAVEIYLKGLEEYRAKRWDAAIALFKQTLEVDPDDGPSQTYIDRCEDFKVLPPPENWDGVFVMKTK